MLSPLTRTLARPSSPTNGKDIFPNCHRKPSSDASMSLIATYDAPVLRLDPPSAMTLVGKVALTESTLRSMEEILSSARWKQILPRLLSMYPFTRGMVTLGRYSHSMRSADSMISPTTGFISSIMSKISLFSILNSSTSRSKRSSAPSSRSVEMARSSFSNASQSNSSNLTRSLSMILSTAFLSCWKVGEDSSSRSSACPCCSSADSDAVRSRPASRAIAAPASA
mmetsp:Transcript_10145/g.37143  ORF Transcript_10145/g.37143 Transcript_10145/m.37143 type:complete len:225 (-) Transcript_10145:761-1435(-)